MERESQGLFLFFTIARSLLFLLVQPPYFLLTNPQSTLKIIHLPFKTAGG